MLLQNFSKRQWIYFPFVFHQFHLSLLFYSFVGVFIILFISLFCCAVFHHSPSRTRSQYKRWLLVAIFVSSSKTPIPNDQLVLLSVKISQPTKKVKHTKQKELQKNHRISMSLLYIVCAIVAFIPRIHPSIQFYVCVIFFDFVFLFVASFGFDSFFFSQNNMYVASFSFSILSE